MEIKEFENTHSNTKDTLRFAWLFVPYNASDRKFKLALHILPVKIVEPTFSYKQYPEVDKFVNENILPKYPCKVAESYSGLEFSFDKSHNDKAIADTICQVQGKLEEFGILHSGIVMAYKGVPDLTYGQAYLEYTTSATSTNILGIIDLLSAGDEVAIRKASQDVPVTSEQKFDPEKDTDMSLADTVIFKKITELTNRLRFVNDVTSVIEKAFKDVKESAIPLNTPKETYSSENSDEYSDFQSHWI